MQNAKFAVKITKDVRPHPHLTPRCCWPPGGVLGQKTGGDAPRAAENWTQQDRGENGILGQKDRILGQKDRILAKKIKIWAKKIEFWVKKIDFGAKKIDFFGQKDRFGVGG